MSKYHVERLRVDVPTLDPDPVLLERLVTLSVASRPAPQSARPALRVLAAATTVVAIGGTPLVAAAMPGIGPSADSGDKRPQGTSGSSSGASVTPHSDDSTASGDLLSPGSPDATTSDAGLLSLGVDDIDRLWSGSDEQPGRGADGSGARGGSDHSDDDGTDPGHQGEPQGPPDGVPPGPPADAGNGHLESHPGKDDHPGKGDHPDKDDQPGAAPQAGAPQDDAPAPAAPDAAGTNPGRAPVGPAERDDRPSAPPARAAVDASEHGHANGRSLPKGR